MNDDHGADAVCLMDAVLTCPLQQLLLLPMTSTAAPPRCGRNRKLAVLLGTKTKPPTLFSSAHLFDNYIFTTNQLKSKVLFIALAN